MTETVKTDSVDGHTKPRYDDIPVSAVLYFGVITVTCTLLSILFVKGLLHAFKANFEAQRAAEVMESSASIQIDQQKKLLEGGGKTISIEEAGKKVLEKYSRQ